MNERLQKKISILTSMSCWDHHKSKDGYYSIENAYNAWDNTTYYTPSHYGYLWEFNGPSYDSFELAEMALENAVNKRFKEKVEWLENCYKDPAEYDVNVPPTEKLKEYIKEFEALQ